MSEPIYANDEILDLVDAKPTITFGAKTYLLHSINTDQALDIRARFPRFKKSVSNLQFLLDEPQTEDDELSPDAIAHLKQFYQFTNAMVAIALGKPGNLKYEAAVDLMFTPEQKGEIISAAQNLSLATPGEGFSKRSA